MISQQYPRQPLYLFINQNHNNNIPILTNLKRNLSQQRKSVINNNNSRISKYQHIQAQKDKRKALGQKKYINQLAQMDYEDKFIEVHTKFTIASKLSAIKKIKAKNQIAEFIEEQEQDQIGFQELMDYKYGKKDEFYFKKNQIQMYGFCHQCDQIHNDHIEVHEKICQQYCQNNLEQFDIYKEEYVYFSLKRIEKCINRMNGREYNQLKSIIQNLVVMQNEKLKQNNNSRKKQFLNSTGYQNKLLEDLFDLFQLNENQLILKQICQKILRNLYKAIK